MERSEGGTRDGKGGRKGRYKYRIHVCLLVC